MGLILPLRKQEEEKAAGGNPMFLPEESKKKMESGHILVTRYGDRCHPGTSWGGARAKAEESC